jgi:hypothetical protein
MRQQFAPGRHQWARAWSGLVVFATLAAAACGEDSDSPEGTVPVTEGGTGDTGEATTLPEYGAYGG